MGIIKLWGTALMLVTLTAVATAQPEQNESDSLVTTVSKSSLFSLSAEIKSRHVWRGGLTCSAWNMQPTLEMNIKNLTVGAWSCHTVDNSYSEVDLYASYEVGNFSATILDYYNPIEGVKKNDFFDYNKDSTRHLVDVNVKFHGTASFPVYILGSTLVYGDDKKENSTKNRYSTYFEAGYTHNLNSDQRVDFFMGGTPHKSCYAQEAAIVNVGFTFHQNVKIMGQYNLPLYVSMVVNPKYENIYFLLGITLH